MVRITTVAEESRRQEKAREKRIKKQQIAFQKRIKAREKKAAKLKKSKK